MPVARTQIARTQLGATLETIQVLIICIILVIAPHTARILIMSVGTPDANVFIDYRAILIFLFDYPLIALLLVSILRGWLDHVWREKLRLTAFRAVVEFGGWCWLLIGIWLFVGMLWATMPLLALSDFAQFALALGGAIVVATLTPHRSALILTMSVAAAIQSVIAIVQWLHRASLGLSLLGEVQFSDTRVYGLTTNPNNLAGYLVIGAYACLWLMWTQRQTGKRRWWASVLLTVTGLGLIATGSRAAILGVLFSVLFVGWKTKQRSNLHLTRMRLGLGAMIVAIAVLLVLLFSHRDFSTRLTYAFDDTLRVISQSPLLGTGGLNLMVNVANLRAGSTEALLLPAHNAYLVIWAELGILGLGLFVMAALLIAYRLWRTKSPSTMITSACLVALLFTGLFDYYIWIDYRSRILFMLMIGLWWGTCVQSTEARPQLTFPSWLNMKVMAMMALIVCIGIFSFHGQLSTPLLGLRPPSGEFSPLKIAALGDSLTEGRTEANDTPVGSGTYPIFLIRSIRNIIPGSTILNYAYGGFDSNTVLDSLGPYTSQIESMLHDEPSPDVVCIWIGSGDLLANNLAEEEAKSEEVFGNLVDSVLGKLRNRYGDSTILAIALLDDPSQRPFFRASNRADITRWGWNWNPNFPSQAEDLARISRRTAAYNRSIRQAAKVYGAILVDLSQPGIFDNAGLMSSEGIYPSAAGYQQIANIWLDSLVTAIRPTVPPRGLTRP